MKKAVFIIFSLIGILTLSSCQSTKNVEKAEKSGKTSKVFVTNSKTINILPADCIESEIDCVYMFSASFGKTEFSVISFIQADDSGFYIDLLNGFGTSIGSILYENQEVSVNCSFIPQKLKGEYIINDLQLVFYKEDCLKNNYKNSKLKFNVENKDETTVRSVYSGKKLIEQAVISEKEISIKNFLRNYEYKLVLSGV